MPLHFTRLTFCQKFWFCVMWWNSNIIYSTTQNSSPCSKWTDVKKHMGSWKGPLVFQTLSTTGLLYQSSMVWLHLKENRLTNKQNDNLSASYYIEIFCEYILFMYNLFYLSWTLLYWCPLKPVDRKKIIITFKR